MGENADFHKLRFDKLVLLIRVFGKTAINRSAKKTPNNSRLLSAVFAAARVQSCCLGRLRRWILFRLGLPLSVYSVRENCIVLVCFKIQEFRC
jgi:hypothetical protein